MSQATILTIEDLKTLSIEEQEIKIQEYWAKNQRTKPKSRDETEAEIDAALAELRQRTGRIQ
jgi:predicted nucleotide-binding protein (sugar kinase/HSP70/actin superfamily)